MNKYFAVFRVPASTMEEWMKNTPPEEIKAQMTKMEADMNAWMAKNEKSIVDKGMPLGKTKSVTTAGVADSKNDLNYYMVVEAESHDAAAKIFADSPHMSIASSSIDVMEVPHMGL